MSGGERRCGEIVLGAVGVAAAHLDAADNTDLMLVGRVIAREVAERGGRLQRGERARAASED